MSGAQTAPAASGWPARAQQRESAAGGLGREGRYLAGWSGEGLDGQLGPVADQRVDAEFLAVPDVLLGVDGPDVDLVAVFVGAIDVLRVRA